MIKLSKDNTKRQLAIHGWAGLLFGFLLYIVVFTGTVLVFQKELGQWSKSGFITSLPMKEISIDGLVHELADNTDQAFWHDIDVYPSQGNLVVFLHTHKKNKKGIKVPYGVQYTYSIDRMKVINKQFGYSSDFDDPPSSSWVEFIEHMHTNLYIPGRFGLYATGLLGLLLLVSAISGFLLHRHLIKDMFLSPRKSSLQINKRDGHNLSATWVLPYAFVLAFTGAFLSFAISLGLPVIAFTGFKGDIQAATTTLVNRPNVNEVTPVSNAKLYNLNDLMDNSSQIAGNMPTMLTIIGYDKPQTIVTTNHPPFDKSLVGHRLMFNGNNGDFVREVAFVGSSPSISSDSLNIMGALHFGSFSGLLSKTLWFGLGLLLCYVIITGFKLWFIRRIKQPNWQKLYLSVPIITYGVPISFLCAGLAFFFAYANKPNFSIESSIWWGFAIGWLLSLVSLIWIRYVDKRIHKQLTLVNNFDTQEDEAGRITRFMAYSNQYFYFLMAYLLILMPVMRWQSNGRGWLTLHNTDNHMVILVDLCFAFIGLFFLKKLIKQQKQTHTQSLLVNNNQAKGNSA